ncbi:MAG: type II secretion system protein [Clostridia bacterium]|nr:type II secretion system protein [Clostridia bacterium]
MKRNNKKGFTIVELVIVIAVIAILSAVLIPTFGGIVDKANESARDQEARNAFTEYLIVCDATPDKTAFIVVTDDSGVKYYYDIKDDGQLDFTETQTGVVCVKAYTGYTLGYAQHINEGPDTDAETDGVQTDGLCDICGATVTP